MTDGQTLPRTLSPSFAADNNCAKFMENGGRAFHNLESGGLWFRERGRGQNQNWWRVHKMGIDLRKQIVLNQIFPPSWNSLCCKCEQIGLHIILLLNADDR